MLQRNYENNISPAALRASGQESHLGSCGSVTVAELDWSQPQQYSRLCPPAFDYVLAADCIYHETLLRQLYRVMLAITNERSTSKRGRLQRVRDLVCCMVVISSSGLETLHRDRCLFRWSTTMMNWRLCRQVALVLFPLVSCHLGSHRVLNALTHCTEQLPRLQDRWCCADVNALLLWITSPSNEAAA